MNGTDPGDGANRPGAWPHLCGRCDGYMMHGYVRCAATGCMVGGRLIADVPLCVTHETLMAMYFSSGPAAPVLPDWSHVVYYVIRKDDADLVKIGTSVNLRHRLGGLGTSRRPVRLLECGNGRTFSEATGDGVKWSGNVLDSGQPIPTPCT